MKWQELLSRITGFSIPVFGVSWNPPEAERSIAKRVLAVLEDKRVLYRLTEFEYPDACERSVEDIRTRLTDEIGKLDADTELAKALRGMRSACREFLDGVQTKHLVVHRLSEYPYPAKHWEFIEALSSLRKDFGYRVAALAVSYGVDIESELQSIVPPAAEAGRRVIADHKQSHSPSERNEMNASLPQSFRRALRLIIFFVPKTLIGPTIYNGVLYWWFVPASMKVHHALANPSVWWKIGVSLFVIPAFLMSRIAAEGLASSLPQKWTNSIHRVIAPLSFSLSLFMVIMAIWLFAPLFGFHALQPKVVALVFCGFVFFAWLENLKKGLGVFAKYDTSRQWLRDVLELSASELLSRDSRPPILYLRSFEAENTKATTIGRFAYIRNPKVAFYLIARRPKESDNMMSFLRKSLAREYKMKLLNSTRSVHDEQAIFTEYFSSLGPYIAIGRPGESYQNMDIGSAKLFISDDDWMSKVRQLIEAAVVIVVEAADSEGLAWEMSEVVSHAQPEQVLLVLPRNEADYHEFCIFAANIFPHPMPEELPLTRLIMFNSDWIPIALQNYTMILEDALKPFMERLDLNAVRNVSETGINQSPDKSQNFA